MIVEQLIFIILAFALFVYMFYQLIKKNDTKYVLVLAIQALRNRNRLYTIICCRRRYWNCNKNNNMHIINNCSCISASYRKVK